MRRRHFAEWVGIALLVAYLTCYWAAWFPDRNDHIRAFFARYVVFEKPRTSPTRSGSFDLVVTHLVCGSCQQGQELRRADQAFVPSEGWSWRKSWTEGEDDLSADYILHKTSLLDRFLAWIGRPRRMPYRFQDDIEISLKGKPQRSTTTEFSIAAPRDLLRMAGDR